MAIEHKSFPIQDLKADSETGILEAIVSVFNNVDSGKEIVRPGFFTKSIEKKLPKGVWMHKWDQPIARTLEAKELLPGDPMLPDKLKELGGTYIKGQFNLDTQRGKEAFSDIKFGIVDEFSIGYRVTKESTDKETGARELIEGDWKEWSPVLVGMNPETAVLSVKADETKDAPKVEQKGIFEDVIEEREESLYFLWDVLCSALYRAQYLSDAAGIDLAPAIDEILAEFGARVRAAFVDPEEQTDIEAPEMASYRGPIKFKGDLREVMPFANHAETVRGAVEAFAQKSASILELVTEVSERRRQIDEMRETKAGATYSSSNTAHMQRIHDAMGRIKKDVGKAHADMAALIDKGKKPEKSDAPTLETASLRTQSLKIQSQALM